MNELQVEKTREGYQLNLAIWCGQTGYIHTVWCLGKLHTPEIGFKEKRQGGRFRNYLATVRKNKVSLPVNIDNKQAVVQELLNWIGEYTEGDWAMDFSTNDPVSLGGPIGFVCVEGELNLYFDSDEEAVLCLLKFR